MRSHRPEIGLELFDPRGERPGAGERPAAVDEEQGLGAGRGGVAAGGGAGAVGGVEGVEERVVRVAEQSGLDGPPRARCLGARAADCRVELAADGEHRVADLLGIESLDRPASRAAGFPGRSARSRPLRIEAARAACR